MNWLIVAAAFWAGGMVGFFLCAIVVANRRYR